MKQSTTVVLGLAVAFVLFFAANVLANATLTGVRLDLTQDKLYTLSKGAREVARGVDEPIRLKLYYSRGFADEVAGAQVAFRRVREMFQEFERASDGGIVLDVRDPEPYSEVEEEAVSAGLVAMPVGASGLGKFYFGLVGTNAVGDREIVPFFDLLLTPTRERFLEYEIARLVWTLANPEKRVVGILSTLPLEGGPPNPMAPRRERWTILDQIESVFETRTLSRTIEEVPEDVDVLVVVHPKELPEETLHAIDQFVLAGGETLVFVDPHCEADLSGRDPRNPTAGLGEPRGSDMPRLFEAWGLELVPNRVAADRRNALTVNVAGGEAWPMVVYFAVGESGFDQDDPVTRDLSEMNLGTPGILRPLEGATTTFQPLLRTSDDSMDVDVGTVQFAPQPKEMLASFVPGHRELVVAARIRGTARTAFPEGPPGAEQAPEDGEDDVPAGTDGQGGQGDADDAAPPEEEDDDTGAAEGSTAASEEGSIHVVVVADCDLLADRFWVRQTSFLGMSLGLQKYSDNGDFVTNVLENLSGGEELIAIRGRGTHSRPFERVAEIRREAEANYLARARELERQIREEERKIEELRTTQGEGGALILTPEVERAIEEARQRIVERSRELRRVQHQLRRDVERLGTRVKWVNILVVPVLVFLGAIALGAYRVSRRKG